MQSFSVGANHAASGIFPHRRFPYVTNYDIVSSAVPSESNTSQVDIAFSWYNPVSDQSNSALWSLEESNGEPGALADTSQSVRMFHDPSRRLSKLQEALSKITHGRLTMQVLRLVYPIALLQYGHPGQGQSKKNTFFR